MIKQTEAQGLRRCRILSAETPDVFIEWLCGQHNKFHKGSGQTVHGLLAEAVKIESGWKKRCSTTGMTSRNPEYQRHYDLYVREASSDFQQNVQLYNETKSLAHTLSHYDLGKEFEACCWVVGGQVVKLSTLKCRV